MVMDMVKKTVTIITCQGVRQGIHNWEISLNSGVKQDDCWGITPYQEVSHQEEDCFVLHLSIKNIKRN